MLLLTDVVYLQGVVVYDDDTANILVGSPRFEEAILMERSPDFYYDPATASSVILGDVPYLQYSMRLTKEPSAPVIVEAFVESTQFCDR